MIGGQEDEEEALTDTQKTEPPLTEEEYNILRRNMSGMTSTSFRRLIEPPSTTKIDWSESNQELFHELTRADTMDNNPGFVNPNLLSSRTDGIESFTVIQEQNDSSSCSMGSHTSPALTHTLSTPSTEHFPGDYRFHCVFEKLNSNQKNKFWEYSERLNKLYIEFNKNIQISFKLREDQDFSDISVRAMAVFAEEASVKEPVLRCPSHSDKAHETNTHFPQEHSQHLIRVDHGGALYQVDPASGRHSVSVPISKPAVGTDTCSRIYKFMCLCSDPGGINRRPVKLIFTLEKSSGETLGRDSLDLRICACPGRDMLKEEKRLRQKEERILKVTRGEISEAKKPRTCSEHPLEDMVLLPVARADFDKMNEFAEAAMIVRHPHLKEEIIKERRRLLAQVNEGL